jgi:spore cortex formation protein SpoVR/YcgB (stage V sporulation)
MVLSLLMDKPYNLRYKRKEEVMNSGTASMWHKFMLNFILSSLLTLAMPMPVSEIVSSSKITKA